MKNPDKFQDLLKNTINNLRALIVDDLSLLDDLSVCDLLFCLQRALYNFDSDDITVKLD